MAQKFCYNSYVARENQNPYLRRNEPVETAKGRRGRDKILNYREPKAR